MAVEHENMLKKCELNHFYDAKNAEYNLFCNEKRIFVVTKEDFYKYLDEKCVNLYALSEPEVKTYLYQMYKGL